ncbi:hypothetical protein TVAG_276710 [Trichomonas vaginalis G3]|uniref:Uncharacterized protein n=1 Tax=Trichomonas vaginalis (strain ATCC PRA-98 / G3) TaxID=412133 RepID=A2FFE0_TRIV3|nr:keratinocyte proline-rich protein family [Trichomonas vaginalis G3]EAX96386.1 hypothetical protein TVAG_276710 [Trichomonas vaginalis G3]KAI5545331.1 keratinocyte proline-rich protein family [Trichomonas vaginalis G3]|eukprot:XP_001309316.1 hypothetical protein [Trichomonas vaginalis G3]
MSTRKQYTPQEIIARFTECPPPPFFEAFGPLQSKRQYKPLNYFDKLSSNPEKNNDNNLDFLEHELQTSNEQRTISFESILNHSTPQNKNKPVHSPPPGFNPQPANIPVFAPQRTTSPVPEAVLNINGTENTVPEPVFTPKRNESPVPEPVFAPKKSENIPQEPVFAPKKTETPVSEPVFAPNKSENIVPEPVFAPQRNQNTNNEPKFTPKPAPAPQQESAPSFRPQKQNYNNNNKFASYFPSQNNNPEPSFAPKKKEDTPFVPNFNEAPRIETFDQVINSDPSLPPGFNALPVIDQPQSTKSDVVSFDKIYEKQMADHPDQIGNFMPKPEPQEEEPVIPTFAPSTAKKTFNPPTYESPQSEKRHKKREQLASFDSILNEEKKKEEKTKTEFITPIPGVPQFADIERETMERSPQKTFTPRYTLPEEEKKEVPMPSFGPSKNSKNIPYYATLDEVEEAKKKEAQAKRPKYSQISVQEEKPQKAKGFSFDTLMEDEQKKSKKEKSQKQKVTNGFSFEALLDEEERKESKQQKPQPGKLQLVDEVVEPELSFAPKSSTNNPFDGPFQQEEKKKGNQWAEPPSVDDIQTKTNAWKSPEVQNIKPEEEKVQQQPEKKKKKKFQVYVPPEQLQPQQQQKKFNGPSFDDLLNAEEEKQKKIKEKQQQTQRASAAPTLSYDEPTFNPKSKGGKPGIPRPGNSSKGFSFAALMEEEQKKNPDPKPTTLSYKPGTVVTSMYGKSFDQLMEDEAQREAQLEQQSAFDDERNLPPLVFENPNKKEKKKPKSRFTDHDMFWGSVDTD